MSQIAAIMGLAPVILVLVIDDTAAARPLGEALVAGSLKASGVTLSTLAALDAIRVRREVDGAVVGAGTAVSTEQFDAAWIAGGEFVVSPGLAEPLARRVIAAGTPYLAGMATAGDLIRDVDLGLTQFKFFPAATAGGCRAWRRSRRPSTVAASFPGGDETNVAEWLAFDPVLCAGRGWVARGTMAKVEQKARTPAALG